MKRKLLLPFFAFLVFSLPENSFAKKQEAVFMVLSNTSNFQSQKTAATLQWMIRELAQADLQKQNIQLFNESQFSSSSYYKASKVRFERAIQSTEEARKSFAQNPNEIIQSLFQSKHFFEHSHLYHFSAKEFQEILFMLALHQFKQKESEEAFQLVTMGHLLLPSADSFSDLFNSSEKEWLQRTRCHMTQRKGSSLQVSSKRGDAMLYLNNQLAGIGSISLKNMVPGRYFFKVVQPGLRPWGNKITLRPNSNISLAARGFPGPRGSFYKELCTKLLSSNEQEKLQDTFDSLKEMLASDSENKIKKMLLACFLPNGSGQTGSLHWFSSQGGTKVKRGVVNISSFLENQKKIMANLLKGMSIQPDTSKSFDQFPFQPIAQEKQCKGWKQFVFQKQETLSKVDSKAWPVAKNDFVLLSLRMGLSLEGKVLGIRGDSLEIEVNSNIPSLRKVRLERKEIASFAKLNEKINSRFRKNQKVFVETVFHLSIEGLLLKDDGNSLEVQTPFGIEVIARNEIKSIRSLNQ